MEILPLCPVVRFESSSHRTYGWALREKKVHGECSGNTRPRTNLIAGKRGKDLLAPVLFEGCTDAVCFNSWLEEHLFNELSPESTIILDNASFHKKKAIGEIATKNGHYVLFLPPYSPDFNPIEKTFAHMKKQRAYATENTSIDNIVKAYGKYLE